MEQYRLWIVGGVFFLLLAVRITTKNIVLRWTAKTGLCSAMMMGINTLLPTCSVALNLYTIAFASVLGLPGVMTMYIVKMMIE